MTSRGHAAAIAPLRPARAPRRRADADVRARPGRGPACRQRRDPAPRLDAPPRAGAADVLALLGAYGVLWLVAPPPNSVAHDLILLPVLPLWVVLNKSLRLYDRDANLVHQSTLNELPKIFHSLSLGARWLPARAARGRDESTARRCSSGGWRRWSLTPALRFGRARARAPPHRARARAARRLGSGRGAGRAQDRRATRSTAARSSATSTPTATGCTPRRRWAACAVWARCRTSSASAARPTSSA